MTQRLHLVSDETNTLAEKASLSLPTVSHMKRGAFPQPHPRTVRQLAQALGVTLTELYTDEEEVAR